MMDVFTSERLALLRQRFPLLAAARQADSHKGSHGSAAVLGGARGMSGAVVLAAVAALRTGAGRVWAAFAQDSLPVPYLPEHPEIMLARAEDCLQSCRPTACAVGCGLGGGARAEAVLADAFDWSAASGRVLLLDADALNLLAVRFRPLPAAAVITPHPLEAARLLDSDVSAVQGDRLAAVLRLVERYRCHVVLKGQHTLVAAPDGRVETNDSGNAGLATAGSGDVLSGVIVSLLAQGFPSFEAACCGVWLHGAAADVLVRGGTGPIGLNAGLLADSVRQLRNLLAAV